MKIGRDICVCPLPEPLVAVEYNSLDQWDPKCLYCATSLAKFLCVASALHLFTMYILCG